MSDTIIRASGQAPYFMMDRASAQRKEMSYEALGLLAYILSRPNDWKVQPTDLQREGCGRDKVYNLLKELMNFRHVIRVENPRDEQGRTTGFSYIVYESPAPLGGVTIPASQPLPESPYTASPDPVNQGITYTKRTHTEKGGNRVPASSNAERERFQRMAKTRRELQNAPSIERGGSDKKTVPVHSDELPSVFKVIYKVFKQDKWKVSDNQRLLATSEITVRDGTTHGSLQQQYDSSPERFQQWLEMLCQWMKDKNIAITLGTVLEKMRGLDYKGIGWLSFDGGTQVQEYVEPNVVVDMTELL